MTALARRLSPIDPPRAAPKFDMLAAIARLGMASYARGLAAHAAVAAPPPLPTWLTLADASRHSGLSVTLLRRLITAGRLPAVRDGAVKVRRLDLDSLDNLAAMAESTRRLATAAAELRAALKGRVQ